MSRSSWWEVFYGGESAREVKDDLSSHGGWRKEPQAPPVPHEGTLAGRLGRCWAVTLPVPLRNIHPSIPGGFGAPLAHWSSLERNPSAHPCSEGTECPEEHSRLFSQSLPLSARCQWLRTKCGKPESPWCAWELLIHHREHPGKGEAKGEVVKRGCSGVTCKALGRR